MARIPFLSLLSWASPLVVLSAMDITTPFLRMLVLTHFLDLRELGFAAALATTLGLFEQVTDMLMYRFVFSVPHEDFVKALAAAHAVSVVRGAAVGLLVALASPIAASIFGLGDDWAIFAALGPIVFIRSLENLGPRSAERDYQYAAQLKSNLVGATLGLGSMLLVAIRTHSHLALYVQLLASASGYVAGTHLFSSTPYRLKIRTLFFARAIRFGYPLMLNGAGLAITNQGDRMLVGALLGLPALAIYSVILLAAIVPMAMLTRMTNSLTLAIFYGAAAFRAAYEARLKLTGRVFPLLFAFYGLGVLTLANILVPDVFGASFRMSKTLLVLLAFSAFFRLLRGDPFASLLLQTSRTKRLALSSWSTTGALIFAGALMYAFRTIESAMLGRLLGEIVALAVTVYLVRNLYRIALADHALATAFGTAVLGIAAALVFIAPVGTQIFPSLAALALGAASLAGAAALTARAELREGFPHDLFGRGTGGGAA
ncbi:MAG: oligosaccharide flippase family protein [Hyphomicrobiales bacterium]|nr:oligosaccharide flippase family protein [Hyphomicrobiales bacterium]